MADPEVRARKSASRRDPWITELGSCEGRGALLKLYRKLLRSGIERDNARKEIDALRRRDARLGAARHAGASVSPAVAAE